MNKEDRQKLIDGYEKEKRPLPFRLQPTPYGIWISEIMAQQTRIEAMLPYYERFMARFPDIPALAAASEEDLHKVWQGLGYYSRARNLKKCAQVLMAEYNGQLPGRKEQLEKLPGIGPYTAGAIASIAFGQRAAAIDGNVNRVFSRLQDYHEDLTRSAAKKQLAAWVEASLPEAELCASYNQALMELGARICIPKTPRCEQCVLRQVCQAYKRKTACELPYMPKKAARRIEHKQLQIPVFIEDGTLYVQLKKRPEAGLLAGLYGFEETLDSDLIPAASRDFAASVHVFSHVEWHMTSQLVEVQARNETFFSLEQIEKELPVPSAFAPFLTALKDWFFYPTPILRSSFNIERNIGEPVVHPLGKV